MSLTLHHFRREVSHVRLPWLLWLALLALQMVVNLEWIAPMPLDLQGSMSPSWLFLVKPAIWGMAFWLVVSSVPEDRPGNPDGFLGTRPLPMRCYVLGRVLAFLVLFIVPFAVQEALYLWFSERPWGEMLIGASEAAFRACAFLGWWLPFSLLWRRPRELWYGVGGILAGLLGAYTFLAVTINIATGKIGYKANPLPRDLVSLRNTVQWPGWLLIGTVILAGVACMHLVKGWNLRLRLASVLVLVTCTMVAIVHVPLPNPSVRPTVQAEVNHFAPGMQPAFTDYQISHTMRSKRNYYVRVEGPVDGFPAEYTPHWRKQQVTLHHRDTTITTAHFSSPDFGTAFRPWEDIPVQSALSSFFPKDTLWRVDYRWAGAEDGVDAGVLKVPEAWGRDRGPFSVEGKYAIDWLKWEKEVDLPLVAGSTATTAGAKWTVLAVESHATPWGAKTSGVLCVTVRLEHPAQGFGAQPWDWTQEFAPLLYAPQIGLVYLSAWSGEGGSPQNPLAKVGTRAESTTWQRRIFRLAWGKVLAPQGPIQKDGEAKLRFVALRRSYAGTSSWEGALPPMTLPADPSAAVYQDSVQEDECFLARLRVMPKLREGATVEEAQQYLADIQDTLQPVFKRRWEEQLGVVLGLLEPLARMHPTLLLNVSDQNPWGVLLGKLATTPEVRKAILAEIPAKPWLGRIGEDQPDLKPLLRELAPLIMNTVTVKEGAYFSRLFMTLREPTHVPWLLKVMEASMDMELYLHCRSFPQHREAADAAARRAALAWMQKSGSYVGDYPVASDWGLALGLRAGMPEVLQCVLHKARVTTAEEQDSLMVGSRVSEAFGFPRLTMYPPGVQEKDRAWLSSLAALTPADFRFDEETRIWSRAGQPGTAPEAPAPLQR